MPYNVPGDVKMIRLFMEKVESCTYRSKDDVDDMDSHVDNDEEFVGRQSSNSPGKDDDKADEDSTQK